MVLDRQNIFSISFTSFNIYLRFVIPNVKLCPVPFSVLPVTLWIIVSDPLRKATQSFSYCTFSSLLPLAILLPYYSIQGPGFLFGIF